MGEQIRLALCLLILKAVACTADRGGVDEHPTVKKPGIQSIQRPSSKATIGAFMLGLFVFLHVLAASELLHQTLHHHDAAHPEVSCVVTMLSHGMVETSVVQVSLPLISTFETYVSHTVETFVGFPISRLLPGRAPPSSTLV